MAKSGKDYKRRNRTVQLGDMIGNALDPALKKRGFASRDLLANWKAIVPAPYGEVAMPDRLTWPRRGSPDPEGAILFLRCHPGHALTISHDGQTIAAAINRYFGYLVVASVKLSANPMPTGADNEEPSKPVIPPERRKIVAESLSHIEDDDLKAALERLGMGVIASQPPQGTQ